MMEILRRKLMGRMTTVAAIACSAMLLTSAATTAQTVADRTTFVTFSGPVSIPGATLPAGTYTFKLADSPANRNIVQVFDKDGMKLFATLLAVAADRTEAEGDPVVTFKETAANRPPAVRYWYYAGERSGSEFIYPKSQAIEIARASGDSVMSVDTDSTSIDDWKKATPSRVTADAAQSSTGTSSSTSTSSASTSTSSTTSASSTTTAAPAMQPMTTAPAQPATTTPEPTSAPAPTTAPAAATAPSPATPRAQPPTAADQTAGTSGRAEPKELPRTASELPTVGLIGVLALAGALMLRARRVNA
jgi:hypothetical protein